MRSKALFDPLVVFHLLDMGRLSVVGSLAAVAFVALQANAQPVSMLSLVSCLIVMLLIF